MGMIYRMSMPPVITSKQMSLEEYLRFEEQSMEKHEYRGGEVVLMAGGTPDHSLIVMNVGGELRNHLKGKPCRVYDSNLRIRIPRTAILAYPDLSIICGPRAIDPDDKLGQSVTNPRVIIEVLSPTTEAFDRGEKFSHYRNLDSLEEYILISQSTYSVESFLRQPEGHWLMTPISGLDAILHIRSLDIHLPLTEIYAGIEPPAPTPAADATTPQ